MFSYVSSSHPRVRAYPLPAETREYFVRVHDRAVCQPAHIPPPEVSALQRVALNVVPKEQLIDERAGRVIVKQLLYQRLLRRWMVNVHLPS